MGKYAANTSVSSELSRLEIEKTLIRYGADNFAYATSNGKALIGFTMYDRQIKFVLTLPCKEEFSKTPTGRERKQPDSSTRPLVITPCAFRRSSTE